MHRKSHGNLAANNMHCESRGNLVAVAAAANVPSLATRHLLPTQWTVGGLLHLLTPLQLGKAFISTIIEVDWPTASSPMRARVR